MVNNPLKHVTSECNRRYVWALLIAYIMRTPQTYSSKETGAKVGKAYLYNPQLSLGLSSSGIKPIMFVPKNFCEYNFSWPSF